MIALKWTGKDRFMTGVDIIAFVWIYKVSLVVSVFIS